MAEAIAEDLAVPSPPKRRKRKSKPKPQNSDPEDSDFSGSESNESDTDIEEVIPNEECRRNQDGRLESQPTKRRKTTHKDGGDDAAPTSAPDDATAMPDTAPTSAPDDATAMPEAGPSSSATKDKGKAKLGVGVGSGPNQQKQGNTTNPIYLFYESVTTDAQGKYTPGSKYWKSYFGEREIVEITEGANWNTRNPSGAFQPPN
ncbi:hypothetical protein B0H14DRAFT_2562342 [Mycena olivaceomarginata]|nr:hypothetical protein B0H14DRAFT_2562342 [Mycena olivaceomarginata]